MYSLAISAARAESVGIEPKLSGSFWRSASIFSHSSSCVSSASTRRISVVIWVSDCWAVSRDERRLSTLFAVRNSSSCLAIFSTSRRFFSTLPWICWTALSQRALFSSSVNASIADA